jgi:ubiquinone/menaquinone biosynthesis C-methylase UbiE
VENHYEAAEPDDSLGYTRNLDRFYTAFAGIYDVSVRRLPVWKTWIRHALPHIVGPRVLEISFGTGYLLTQYADRVKAHGVDYNRRMLDVARTNLTRTGRAASLVRANVEHLPYRDGWFDSLVNTMAFSGYPNATTALSEMKRVLQPGGRLILIDYGQPSNGNWIGRSFARFWTLAGDIPRDMGRLFEEFELDFVDQEIGAAGGLHLYVATKANARCEASRSRVS